MAQKISKNQHRRKALKERKEKEKQQASLDASKPREEANPVEDTTPAINGDTNGGAAPEVDFEVNNDIYNDPIFKAHFASTFKAFQGNQEEPEPELIAEDSKPQVFYGDDDDGIFDEEEEAKQKTTLSRREKRVKEQLSIAELKSIVERPELVEWTDVTSNEPKLLVALKSRKNVIPVPPHWQLKREYLSSKRGVEKKKFALPKFIKDTGIQEMRDAALEKQAEASLKQQQRARVQPKMGKLDIEYGVLYDAFFKHQTKPELTRYGDIYYEGKEWDTNLKHLKPGDLSEELRDALGMLPGTPPPWLVNQQRWGPPPSLNGIKLPGVNAPIPPGANWGMSLGQWGRPPVDESNRPLFGGDLFGLSQQPAEEQDEWAEHVDKSLWGELVPQQIEDDGEEVEDDDDDDEDDEKDGYEGPTEDNDVGPPVGRSTNISSYGRPDIEPDAGDFVLRKDRQDALSSGRSAGTVVGEQQGKVSGFLGSDRRYNVGAAQAAQQGLTPIDQQNPKKRKADGDVDVSVDVDALEGGNRRAEYERLYEQQRRAEQPQMRVSDADMDSLIAEGNASRLKKDQERRAKR